jgi:hypothetical protein
MANQNRTPSKIPYLWLIFLTGILMLAACGSVSNTPSNSSSATTNDMAQTIQTLAPTTPITPTQHTAEESVFPTHIPTPASKPFTTTANLATINNEEAPPVCKPDEQCFEITPITATLGTTAIAPPLSATATTAEPIGSEILFLREGVLTAYDNQRQQERQIAAQVRSFAATPDGRLLALVRQVDESNNTTDVWVVQRDGSGLRQMTRDTRNEHNLSWSPDGMTLIYDSSTAAIPSPPEWQMWAGWCSASEVRMLDIPAAPSQPLRPVVMLPFPVMAYVLPLLRPPKKQKP